MRHCCIIKIVISACILILYGCTRDKKLKNINCGSGSDAEAVITNVTGKIEFNTYNLPVSYMLHGYYGTGLMVCTDSTFTRLLTQNKVMDGDSIVFGGEAKNTCNDCEFCGLISVTSMSKK